MNTLSILSELYRATLREMLLPICIFDLQMELVFSNKAFKSLYGSEGAKLAGSGMRFTNALDATYKSEMAAALRDPKKGRWEGTVQMRGASGRTIDVLLVANCLHAASGELIGYHVTHVNPTKRSEHEERVRREVYRGISLMSSFRDRETAGHQVRVSQYCHRISKGLGLGDDFCSEIQGFSSMHDLGKIGIPDGILLAPRGLTAEERSVMKTHTTLGFELFRGEASFGMAAEIAHTHHERWDGMGYPQGLRKDSIPLSGRITAVADVYDALRSSRPYKTAWSHSEALSYIVSESARQFDPTVVEAFAAAEQEMESIFEECQ
jgi:PAS domain S-box-containing protein